MLNWPPKSPTETIDFSLDWKTRDISGDPISSFVATVKLGTVVVGNQAISTDGTKTTVWLSGGQADENCEILLRATTQSGRILEETMSLKIAVR